jgi:class 3 adenylate cyclase
MLCSRCGSENPDGAKFCDGCAAPLVLQCQSCGTSNRPGARFCIECAAALGAASSAGITEAVRSETGNIALGISRESHEISDGERKTVTALFADIKGSTELMRELDPEEARAIVDPVLQLMMAAVHRYGGYVAQSTGDGIFALFGAPVAHEDHPQRALHAALAMQEELRRYADRLRADGKIPVEARVGVNTGEVVVRTIETGGHTEYTPVGHVTNLAARMQTAAPAGSIAASEATQRLCEGYFEFRALGPTAVKGLDAPVEVYEVVRAGPLKTHFQLAARRGLTKFVGREREMAAMAGALEQTKAGHGQIVAAVGEAGAGKSRLMYEFKATIPDGCKVLEAYSVSYGKASAWLPVIEFLRGYFGIQDADDPPTRRDKVRAKLAALDPMLSDALPYLLGLLGIQEGSDPLAQMDPQVKRRRTFDAIKRIIVRESLNQPTHVIFEDLHWIDSETQALLDLLADSIANSRVLLLVNYRPEYRHGWANKSYYSQFRLEALGRESASEMLSALLGDGIELAPFKRLVIERTEGNPFFIEEMVQALFDEGALVRNGVVKVTRSLSQLRLPPTVQGILASRIDRLSAEQKELLQTLAVIGRESPLGLVRQVTSQVDTELERMLAELQASEFIYEQPALAGAQYIFKHALTQEVAYGSVLVERRRLLHERTGEAIEALFRARIDDHLAELAHHYSRTTNTRKAVEYLVRAGSQAAARSAYSEAITRLSSALDFLKHLPDDAERARQELSVQSVLGLSLAIAKGFAAAELEPVYARARELCAKVRDPALTFRPLQLQWLRRYWKMELHDALELADELLATAEEVEDPAMLLTGNYARGTTLYFLGELISAKKHLEKAVAVFDLRQSLPKELELRRVDSFTYTVLWPLPTWLSRSCLGEIARNAGGGSAIFRSLRFGAGSLLCGYTYLGSWGRNGGAKAHRRGDGAHRSMRIPEPVGTCDHLARHLSDRPRAPRRRHRRNAPGLLRYPRYRGDAARLGFVPTFLRARKSRTARGRTWSAGGGIRFRREDRRAALHSVDESS